jgi:outer membrane receptor protein involved in Fe transport
VKASLLDGRVGFDASYFFMTEDGVVLSTRQGPFFLPTNAGEQRYKGLESAVTVAVTPQLSVFGNVGIYRNRFGEFVIQSEDGPEFDEVITGNRLPIAPDYIVNVGASFQPARNIEGTFEVKRVSDVLADRANTVRIDPYTLVDAAASYTRGRLRFTLSAHNLLNEEYYSNGSDESADPGRPRQVLFTTSVSLR